MTFCGLCGNESEKLVVMGGTTAVCAPCALRLLAPACAACGEKVIGYGLNARGQTYWCAQCARDVGCGEELSESA